MNGWVQGAGSEFVFHYTNEQAARALLDGEPYLVGHRGNHGFGMYATHIPPEDEQTLHDVAINAFKGDVPEHAITVEIAWVIVLWQDFGPEFTFVQAEADGYDWLIQRDQPGAQIPVDGQIAGAARWTGTAWEAIELD